MYKRVRQKLDSKPSRPLVIFAWAFIGIISLLTLVSAIANTRMQQESNALGDNVSLTPSPRIFSVIIPSSSLPGSEVIIRGGKFGSRGQVCFRFLETEEPSACPYQFNVLVWTAGSIRAQIPEIEKGEGTLWVIMGEGRKSNEVDFIIE